MIVGYLAAQRAPLARNLPGQGEHRAVLGHVGGGRPWRQHGGQWAQDASRADVGGQFGRKRGAA